MSVRKRILVSGEIRWQVDYRDQKGKRRSRQFETQKEAKNYETTVRGEIRAGTHVSDSASVTVAKASELWLDRCRLDQLEAGTVRNYRQHLNLHILPSLGAVKLSRLTRPVVESFKDQFLEKCSRSTAAKVMVSLKSLLADAQRRGLAVQNVASGVTVKLAGRHEKRIEIPTKDDIRAMLNVAGELWQPTEPWRALIVTAVFSGLRSSELRGLVWDNVDFDRRIIQVRQRADFRNQMGSPKSKAGTRDVPMAPLALNTLRQWKLACPKTEAGLVFPTKNLNVICHAEMHRAWNQLLQAVGLPRLRYRFHDLRHVGASLFIEQGWSPKKVMAVMGHGSIQMTFDLYGHLWATPEDDAAAMAQIEARLLR